MLGKINLHPQSTPLLYKLLLQQRCHTRPVTNIKPPSILNISGIKAEDFRLWLQQWKNYEIATNLNTQPDVTRRATFLSIIGPDALKVYNTFELHEDHSVRDIIRKFETYLEGQINETFERYKFNKTNQQA